MGSFLKLSYRLGPGILSKIAFASYKGRSDPTPIIASILFGMNSSSSQLLDLLQALRLGQIFFFPHLLEGYP